MRLDYQAIRKNLKGTPLAGLSDKQIREAIIGDYPMLYGSKTLVNIWHNVLMQDDIEISRLKFIEAKTILSALELRSIKKGSNTIADNLKSIRELLNKLENQISINKVQAQIIRDQELALLEYEIKTRSLEL